jgi:hypothetical protein
VELECESGPKAKGLLDADDFDMAVGIIPTALATEFPEATRITAGFVSPELQEELLHLSHVTLVHKCDRLQVSVDAVRDCKEGFLQLCAGQSAIAPLLVACEAAAQLR